MHYSAQLYCKHIISQYYSQVVGQNRSCNIVHLSMGSYVKLGRKLRLLYSTLLYGTTWVCSVSKDHYLLLFYRPVGRAVDAL